MNTISRKPLIAMIALSAALAAPMAFAQVDTSSTPPTGSQVTTQAQQADIEAAQQTARDAAQETGEAQMDSPPTAAAQAEDAASTDADASATGAAIQGSQQQGSASAGQQGWEELDANRDGSISREEAANNAGLAQIFDSADSDADGVLTADEYRGFVNKNYEQPESN